MASTRQQGLLSVQHYIDERSLVGLRIAFIGACSHFCVICRVSEAFGLWKLPIDDLGGGNEIRLMINQRGGMAYGLPLGHLVRHYCQIAPSMAGQRFIQVTRDRVRQNVLSR